MAKNGKETNNTINIYIIMHFVRNGEECNMHNIMWYEGGIQLADIGTMNVREYGFNPRLGYDMVILDNLYNTCTRGVIGYRRVRTTMCSE